MVLLNGVAFGNEQYKNGETIFRTEKSLVEDRVADIRVKFGEAGDIFRICMAVEYAKEYANIRDIKVEVSNFYMVDRLDAFLSLLYQLGLKEKQVSVHKAYNYSYNTRIKEEKTEELRFSGDASIAEFLLNKISSTDRGAVMYYLPYGRMDRVVADKIFAFKYFANIINSFNFYGVYTCDTHNDTSLLINRLTVMTIYDVLERVLHNCKPDVICYPDSGAYNKYSTYLEDLLDEFGVTSIYAIKLRDSVEHENIVRYSLNKGDIDLTGKKVLIVDDICSTGGTIIKAALALKENGAKEIEVYATHCENSVFNGPLFTTNLISKIHTTNSLDRDRDCSMIEVYNI